MDVLLVSDGGKPFGKAKHTEFAILNAILSEVEGRNKNLTYFNIKPRNAHLCPCVAPAGA